MCPCVILIAHWTEADLLTGDSMEPMEEEEEEEEDLALVAGNSWMSSTSPHILSWCSLQQEQEQEGPPYPPSLPANHIKPGCMTSSLLHYHMNGRHLAIYCTAMAGKSLGVIGSHTVG